jgi:hypothetical protein
LEDLILLSIKFFNFIFRVNVAPLKIPILFILTINSKVCMKKWRPGRVNGVHRNKSGVLTWMIEKTYYKATKSRWLHRTWQRTNPHKFSQLTNEQRQKEQSFNKQCWMGHPMQKNWPRQQTLWLSQEITHSASW